MSATAFGFTPRSRLATGHAHRTDETQRASRAENADANLPAKDFRELGSPGAYTGEIGDTIKTTVRVEKIMKSGNGMQSYLVRDSVTGNVLQWTSARRYGIFVGEHLRISGIVAAHTTVNGLRITRLRNCFNPLRVS